MLGGTERITPGCARCQYSKGNAVTVFDVFRIVVWRGRALEAWPARAVGYRQSLGTLLLPPILRSRGCGRCDSWPAESGPVRSSLSSPSSIYLDLDGIGSHHGARLYDRLFAAPDRPKIERQYEVSQQIVRSLWELQTQLQPWR